MAGRGWFATAELFVAEEFIKAMVRLYGDANPNKGYAHFEPAVKVALELWPWIPNRYEEVNGRPFPKLDDKNFQQAFRDTKSRRAARQGIAKQKGADPLIRQLIAERKYVSMEEAETMGLALGRTEVLQYVYITPFYWDKDLKHFAGTKPGRTAKAQFRVGQEKHANDKFYFPNEYGLLVPLGVRSVEFTEKLQDDIIANIISRGFRVIYKKEYTNAPLDDAKTAMLLALVKAGIEKPVFIKRWDAHDENKILEFRKIGQS